MVAQTEPVVITVPPSPMKVKLHPGLQSFEFKQALGRSQQCYCESLASGFVCNPRPDALVLSTSKSGRFSRSIPPKREK